MPSDVELGLRILLGFALAFAVGFERELRDLMRAVSAAVRVSLLAPPDVDGEQVLREDRAVSASAVLDALAV